MRINPIPLITGLLLCTIFSFSQKDTTFTLRLRNGNFVPEKNITTENTSRVGQQLQKVNGKSFAYIQFDKIPTENQKQQLKQSGIELLEYIPANTYSVLIRGNLNNGVLQAAGARSLFTLSAEQKMHPSLAKGILPSWAVKTPGMADLWISFPKSFSFEEIKTLLQEKKISITTTDYSLYNIIGVRLSRDRITELASFPFIEYTEPAPHGDQLLNFESKNDSRGSILQASASVGGYDLKGEGMTVGIGDDADPKYHVDFTGRIIDFGPAGYLYHGTHVHGTVAGAGISNETLSGYAPRSRVVTQMLSGIISNAPTYVSDYDMVVTNNSYGDVVGDCTYMGFYDLESRIIDLQSIAYPNLQHVFAAGNDGALNCPPYPAGFRTVLSGFQSAKNVIAVGASQRNGSIASFSSKGPVNDGRIKPELTADGNFTISTIPEDIYGVNNGTSMAAPAVTGGLVLLYQRYKQMNGGANPKNGLMKALICNGGSDFGNTGPDFTNGFGRMNLDRSIKMLNSSSYFISSVNNGGNNAHNINVPAGTAKLKIMLYWNDPAAAVMASTTLINDLDLEVTTPAPSLVLPYLLDTVAANVNNAATTGADHINNIEQVVITNPATGIFTVNIKGTSVPSGPQEYFLVYDIIPAETKLIYPIGDEAMIPGSAATIQWESYGDPANDFKLEYSLDNGSIWTTINANVAPGLRQLAWTVPSGAGIPTDQALIRITRNGTGFTNTSFPFKIIDWPVISLAPTQCEGYFSFQWTPVAGANDYEVFELLGTEMVSIGTTNATSYTLSGLNPSSEYWVTVCARINGKRGRKGLALKRVPNTGSCAGSVSDNDIRMDSIIAPVYGRIATSTALIVNTVVSARIKNLDDANITSFNMLYSVNGIPIANEPVAAVIAGGNSYVYNFTTTYDFSAAGNYILNVEVQNTTGADPVSINNSITDTIRQLNNTSIVLPFIDNLETATPRSYYRKRFGIEGIDRYDFSNTDTLGRFATFLSSGMAYSGSKSLIMDLDGYNNSIGSDNYIYGTYNLAGIDAATKDIRLDFQFKSHGDSVSSPVNKIWVRGDDTKPWLEAFTLSTNGNAPGIFKKTKSLEISDLLTANSQNFSSSFQVRFGQFGIVRINDNYGFQGHNFDDIRLYEAIDDIQMLSIDTPTVISCGLNNSVPVKVTIRNSSFSAISNIPVRLVIDGGSPIIENIPFSIPANSSYQYTFTATADLSATGNHTVLVNVQYASDNFKENDTTSITLVNSVVIGTFPHIEDFESSDGGWFSAGTNSSWQYGIPAATSITKAASGVKAWKTSLSGNYNDMELSYLYSPCYNIAGMTNPTLSLNIALDLENCGSTLCDGAYFEYSENGNSWQRLGSNGAGTNWYNKSYTNNNLWSVENYTRWHVATVPLPTGLNTIRFRIVVTSDQFVNKEGIAIDDIHVYDNTLGIYNGVTLGSPVSQNINGGTNWIDFTSSGKLIASIQPNNENMGNTDVQVYINTGSVRNDGKQYYHDRNITIKPATTTLSDSAIVRFYFLDSETENLINATGCSGCTKPAMVTELGITKYSDPDDNFENGNLGDNIQGTYSFLNAGWNRKIPFDKGYYAEFRVKDFSEFWLNNGGPDLETPLPVELIDFTARKKNKKDVLLQWKLAMEQNVNRYEIEVAKGSENYQQHRFEKSGEVKSLGNTNSTRNYQFSDAEAGKSGVRYYRLKIIDNDNSFVYSPVRPVLFKSDIKWQVYPNPSQGVFNIIYQLAVGEQMNLKLYDVTGKIISQSSKTGNGFLQKTIIDLQHDKYAKGIYLLKLDAGEKTETMRLVKF